MSSGFGHGSFGHFPFGRTDYGNEVVVESFNQSYLEDEEDPSGKNQTLLHYLYTIRDSVNRVKSKIDMLPEQVDFTSVRQDILKHLGTTIGVHLDDAEPEEFQRSLVGAAVQFYQIKGTEASYRIRGKISGFDVEVKNLYKIAPYLVPLFPTDDVFEIPIGSGDFYTDLPPGSVSGTPTEVSCDYCLTAAIKISFTVVKVQPPAIAGEPNFFDRLVSKLRDIIPIHVRDLLFEIVANILVDEHQYIEVRSEAEETTFTPAHMFFHFDAVPADVVNVDNHGYIQGTANIEAA